MTTESKQEPRRGVSPLLGSAAVGTVVIALLGLAGWLCAQAAGLTSVLAGGALALVVLLTSTAVVNAAAGIMPGASLLFAWLTYFLQVFLLAVVAIAIGKAGWSEEQFSRGWFAGALIGVTLAWIAAHAWLFTRLRIPAYDLHPGGER